MWNYKNICLPSNKNFFTLILKDTFAKPLHFNHRKLPSENCHLEKNPSGKNPSGKDILETTRIP